jgi:putative ABC transport system permease protein
MVNLVSHLRYAVRLLFKSPGFTITTVLILGLGIGANTAIFSLIEGVLLKPLPYPNAERLVRILQPSRGVDKMSMAYSDYLDFCQGQHSLQDLTIYRFGDFQVTGNGDPERISGAYVSGSFFKVFGRPFRIGRPFGDAEDKAIASVAVLSESLWRTRFNSDPKLIGKNLVLNGRSFQIIGVTPEQGDEEGKIELYVPFSFVPNFADVKSRRSGHQFDCVGRLKNGVTLETAQADFEVINNELVARYPETSAGFDVRLVPFLNSVVGDYSTMLWLLGAAVGCLLLITCANIANLLLARARQRQKEMAVRTALGASRRLLVAQVLIENFLLAMLGGIAGLLASFWMISWIRTGATSDVTRFQQIDIDGATLVFLFALTLVTTVLFGFLPAWTISRTNLNASLAEEGGRSGTVGRERHRSQAILVIGQVALALVLLVGAGLLTRSFLALQNVALGFNPDHILTADVYLADTKYTDDSRRKAFFDELLQKVQHLPKVTSAGLSDNLPFYSGDFEGLSVVGQPEPDPDRAPFYSHQIVSPDYFRTLGISLIRGRLFDNQDQTGRQNVVIINEAIARRYFGEEDAVGKQLEDHGHLFGRERHYFTIVGVVANVQQGDPETQKTPFQAYYPYSQRAGGFGETIKSGTLVLHVNDDPQSVIAPLRKAVAEIDPDLPLTDIGLFDDLIAKVFATKRLAVTVVSIFSGAALLLAAVGLYAVLSYAVSQRTREIGVRMALGAQTSDILGLVTRQGLKIVSIGLLIGFLTSFALIHFIKSSLFEVSPSDPIALGSSVLALGLAALLACLLPAFRATRISPTTALKE